MNRRDFFLKAAGIVAAALGLPALLHRRKPAKPKLSDGMESFGIPASRSYSRVLTAEETDALFNGGKGLDYPFAEKKSSLLENLQSYWDYEDGKLVQKYPPPA